METVTDKVIADIKQRSEVGKKKYGKELHTFNDRDALQDAYEECLDMAQYLKQAIMEQECDHTYLSRFSHNRGSWMLCSKRGEETKTPDQ